MKCIVNYQLENIIKCFGNGNLAWPEDKEDATKHQQVSDIINIEGHYKKAHGCEGLSSLCMKFWPGKPSLLHIMKGLHNVTSVGINHHQESIGNITL